MPRTPEVDQHPQKQKIIEALVKRVPYRKITERFGVSAAALSRYLNRELVERAAKAKEAMELKDGQAVMRHLTEALETSTKMRKSCDAYLQDPDDPDLYYLGPREEDVEVLCVIRNGEGKIVKRKKARLAALLAAAATELLGVRVDPGNPWGVMTDHLIAWDVPAPPGYLPVKRRISSAKEATSWSRSRSGRTS